MKFSRKQTPVPEPPAGRRRPLSDDRGESRPQAFSYYAQRPANATPKSQPERPVPEAQTGRRPAFKMPPLAEHISTRYKLGLALSALVLTAGLVLLLSLSTSPRVEVASASSQAYYVQNTTVYQQAAARALGGSLFNRSKLTVDTAKVSQELTSQYPELRDVSVDLPLFGVRPVVRVTPYPPAFILTTTSNGAFLIDTSGRALISASQVTDNGELAVPKLEDKSGLRVELGKQVLSRATVNFARQVTAVLDAADIAYSRLVLPANSSELDVYISGKPYFVRFNLQGEARMQTGAFIATKQRLESERVTPSQYIDVRVADRAYYK